MTIRRFIFVLTGMILLSFIISVDCYGRKWRIAGQEIEGTLVDRDPRDSSCVIMNLRDGRGISSIPISSFSSSDQVYILDNLTKVSEKSNSGNKQVVTVTGKGKSMEEAKRDAYRNAVEKVAGTLVGVTSSVINDEIMEEIRTSSNAYIEKQKLISHEIDGRVYRVKMELTVIKSSLASKLRLDKSSKGSVLNVDGAALVDSIEFKAKSEKEDALFLFSFLESENFPYRFIKTEFIGEPEIVYKDGMYEYTVHWRISVNAKRYNAFIERLEGYLDRNSLQKTGFPKTFKKVENGWLYYPKTVSNYREKNVWLFFVKEYSPGTTVLKYKAYELPRKFAYPLFIYKCVVPRLHIQLLDSHNSEVKSYSCLLNSLEKNGYSMECFNLFPSVGNDYYSLSANENTNSSVIGTLNNRCNLLFSIAPYVGTDPRNSGTKFFVQSLTYSLTFKFSKEQLSRVKTAKIFISSKNPDMRIVSQKIEQALDQEMTDFRILGDR